MPSLPSFRHLSRIAAAMLLATLCAGCVRPLAWQHEFFEPLNGSADRIGMQARHAIGHHRALQAARHACRSDEAASVPAEETNVPDGPSAGFAAANRKALADLCAAGGQTPAAAYGGTSNAYRRWVEDQVRELPQASETAASAAGGS